MKFLKLIFCLALVYAIAYSASWFTAQTVHTWYPTLVKAPWSPPNWVFPVVWPILYTLMGVSLWLVVVDPRGQNPFYTGPFLVQLFLNFCWSYLFFYLQNPAFGLGCIVLLSWAISWTMDRFRRISPLASVLLIPYLLWVVYAFTLNLYIWMYNWWMRQHKSFGQDFSVWDYAVWPMDGWRGSVPKGRRNVQTVANGSVEFFSGWMRVID